MRSILHHRSFHIGLAVLVIGVVIAMMLGVGQQEAEPPVTAMVEVGDVRQLVSVSGVADARQTANLAFPVAGTVSAVLVAEGDEVAAGDALISLDSRTLQADRQDAVAALNRARADRDELLAGPTATARDATTQSVTLRQEALETTIRNENRKVENALRNLLSAGLTAYSDDGDTETSEPIVSGTYQCDEEGQYRLEVFTSGTASGFSYRLSGLESGTYPISVDRPIALGTCGLSIEFSPSENYNLTTWYIDIPNTRSSTYVANRNAYALAQTQAESAIALAERDLALAEANATDANAPARNEAIVRADAAVEQARARLARIDSTIADRTLTAPFPGTITTIDVLPGETVGTGPVVTMLTSSAFEITARIPEIDIGRLEIGQAVHMTFDARADEVVDGTIEFISLTATEIDGVAYYEATIAPVETPSWMRSGLNADVEIITSEAVDALRIPSRFLIQDETGYQVLRQVGETFATTTVEVVLLGNDGYAAITGISDGETIVAP